MPQIETDYLVVGAGATGMAFVDTLVAESDVDVVDRLTGGIVLVVTGSMPIRSCVSTNRRPTTESTRVCSATIASTTPVQTPASTSGPRPRRSVTTTTVCSKNTSFPRDACDSSRCLIIAVQMRTAITSYHC